MEIIRKIYCQPSLKVVVIDAAALLAESDVTSNVMLKVNLEDIDEEGEAE